MTSYYPLLSLISMAVFAGLGWTMAQKRNRHAAGWAIGGALLPPVLIALKFMDARPRRPARPAPDKGELDGG